MYLSYIYAKNVMKIELIEAGRFYADGGAMFGAIPKTAWKRRYPSNEDNGCILTMRCALVTTPCGRVILIDNGAGNKHLDKLSYYKFFGLNDIYNELRQRNILPQQVTDVVLTHLHFDHCGYTTLRDDKSGLIVPAFPNATCWVSSSQWENFLYPNSLEKDSYFPENLLPVFEAGKLNLIEQDTELCKGLTLRIYNGHTPGQLVPYIKTDAHTFVFAGDVIPLASSVSPEWISAYDTFPVTSYTEKIRLLEEAASQKQILIYCHDTYTSYSGVKKINNFYKTTPPGIIM